MHNINIAIVIIIVLINIYNKQGHIINMYNEKKQTHKQNTSNLLYLKPNTHLEVLSNILKKNNKPNLTPQTNKYSNFNNNIVNNRYSSNDDKALEKDPYLYHYISSMKNETKTNNYSKNKKPETRDSPYLAKLGNNSLNNSVNDKNYNYLKSKNNINNNDSYLNNSLNANSSRRQLENNSGNDYQSNSKLKENRNDSPHIKNILNYDYTNINDYNHLGNLGRSIISPLINFNNNSDRNSNDQISSYRKDTHNGSLNSNSISRSNSPIYKNNESENSNDSNKLFKHMQNSNLLKNNQRNYQPINNKLEIFNILQENSKGNSYNYSPSKINGNNNDIYDNYKEFKENNGLSINSYRNIKTPLLPNTSIITNINSIANSNQCKNDPKSQYKPKQYVTISKESEESRYNKNFEYEENGNRPVSRYDNSKFAIKNLNTNLFTSNSKASNALYKSADREVTQHINNLNINTANLLRNSEKNSTNLKNNINNNNNSNDNSQHISENLKLNNVIADSIIASDVNQHLVFYSNWLDYDLVSKKLLITYLHITIT